MESTTVFNKNVDAPMVIQKPRNFYSLSKNRPATQGEVSVVTLSKILDDLIARINRNEPIESCLDTYPDLRYDIEQLLHVALSVYALPKVTPSDKFRKTSKARLMNRIGKSLP